MSCRKDKPKSASRFLGLSMMFSAALVGLAITESESLQFFYFLVMAALLPLFYGLNKGDKSIKDSQVASD